jgi:hypothetical protein
MKLFNIDENTKTVKGQKVGYLTAIQYLAPFNLSGHQVCAMAEAAQCHIPCLNTAGRGRFNSVQQARLARTKLLFDNPEAYFAQAIEELIAAKRKAARLGFKLCVRLNGTSDLRWEDMVDPVYEQTLFDIFSEVQFYDYTKIPNRKVKGIQNYHLTYSYTPTTHSYLAKAKDNYGLAVNLAVVFAGALPKYYLGRDVYDGDESDLRFLDPKGVVIGLKAKGKAKTQPSGLVVA